MAAARARATFAAVAVAAALLAACSVEQPTQISASGFGAYEVSVAVLDDAIAVGWYDTRDGNAEIYLQWLDADGAPRGAAERLTDDPEASYEVDLAAVGDGLAVAWYDKDAAGRLQATLGLWRRGGGFAWRTALSAPAHASRNPVVRADGERIFAAWIEAADRAERVRAAWWSADGRVLDGPVELGPAGATTWNLNAALEPRTAGTVGCCPRAHVVYDARIDTGVEELYLATWQGDERRSTRLTADDGHRSKYPDLALADGRAALTWFDERDGKREVYLAAGTLRELEAGVEPRARRVTATPGESIGAYLAWNGPRIGLAWSDASGGPHEVYFQAFDAAARPLGGARRLTRNATRSLIPAIRPARDGFAIAWNEVEPGPGGMHDPATRSEVSFVLVR